ncbi:hypothetical protein LUD75_18570 [Epilithonimonas sp. JDS]|uniref:hypothetical protein n=1 Tax=Epilithonimonas sp. JDS TaxID=2902797 RepID=UPI001E51FDC4|nr:hypothetical protein [Epilithonimonas sp. JDS]MCD9856735.1 hypothetical protein [Epilithonimonas sp. JDS]
MKQILKTNILILITSFLFNSNFNSQVRPDAVYGDYNGYWTSTNANGTLSRETNNLVGFTIGSTIYGTGADNSVLTSHGITNFVNENYKAFPSSFSVLSTANDFLIGQPAYANGVLQTNATKPNLSCDFSLAYYLRDGKNGLDLSTAIFNIPKQDLVYYVNVLADINPSCISDNIPDIIVTQVGEPHATFTDIFKFTDINGVTIGNEKAVAFSSATPVGKAQWNFYSASVACPYPFNSGFSNTPRDVRVLTFKLSDFGITLANYTSAVKFVQVLSGFSDVAFSAYSTNSMSLYCLENAVTTGTALDTRSGITSLNRAGAETVNNNWPMVRKGGYLALESNKKPFVITRSSTANLANITNPVEGMMVYDTTENCLKIYVNAAIGWRCYNKKTCP